MSANFCYCMQGPGIGRYGAQYGSVEPYILRMHDATSETVLENALSQYLQEQCQYVLCIYVHNNICDPIWEKVQFHTKYVSALCWKIAEYEPLREKQVLDVV